MRFFLRILGTWAFGLALILVVKDITISLAKTKFYLSSFSQTWVDLHEASWLASSQYILKMSEFVSMQKIVLFIFNSPAWIILIILGVLFLILGRKKKTKSFVQSKW